MNPIKNIIVATALSALSVGYLGTAQAAETVKPLQGVSFHTETKDAVAYYLADKGACKVVLMMAERDAQPTRFEAAISGGESTRYEFAEGKSLEFTCQADAQAMTINSQPTFADKR